MLTPFCAHKSSHKDRGRTRSFPTVWSCASYCWPPWPEAPPRPGPTRRSTLTVSPYYYRTEDGAKVDLLFERGGAVEMAIEIKRSAAPGLSRGFSRVRGSSRKRPISPMAAPIVGRHLEASRSLRFRIDVPAREVTDEFGRDLTMANPGSARGPGSTVGVGRCVASDLGRRSWRAALPPSRRPPARQCQSEAGHTRRPPKLREASDACPVGDGSDRIVASSPSGRRPLSPSITRLESARGDRSRAPSTPTRGRAGGPRPSRPSSRRRGEPRAGT